MHKHQSRSQNEIKRFIRAKTLIVIQKQVSRGDTQQSIILRVRRRAKKREKLYGAPLSLAMKTSETTIKADRVHVPSRRKVGAIEAATAPLNDYL